MRTKRDPEYDRFGPWILEITETDPLPLLFVPFFHREEDPLYCVKIPRQMDRKDVSPGMNMYDYVVALYEDDILILERVEENVNTLRFPYREIVALRNRKDLLRGNLHIHMPKRCFCLPYNTISARKIEKISGVIRTRYDSGSPSPAADIIQPSTADLKKMSFFFRRLVDNYRSSHPEKKLLACQTEVAVTTIDESFCRRIYYGAIDKRLLESIHFSDGRELEIVGRGKPWGYRWQAIYSLESLFLPIKNIRKIEQVPEDVPGIEILNLDTTGSVHSFLFANGNPGLENYQTIMNREMSCGSPKKNQGKNA